jgi:hypothetical protein
MNPLGHRILEVLQKSPDGHSTAFNIFNVLNRDGYYVTKNEFEEACKKLHDDTCITYQPVQCSLIDIPIGTLDLLITSPALPPLSLETKLVPGVESLSEATVSEPSASGIRRSKGSTPRPNPALQSEKSSPYRAAEHTSVFAIPILLTRALQRMRASSRFSSFPGFSFRF